MTITPKSSVLKNVEVIPVSQHVRIAQNNSTKTSKKNPLPKHTLGEALGSHRQWLEIGADHPIDFGSQPEKYLEDLHLFGS